jgi:RNA polymerase sigma-70 factor (ECF subfamily)
MPHLAYSAPAAKPPAVGPWVGAVPELSDRELLWRLRDAVTPDQVASGEVALDELIRRKTRPLLQLVGRMLSDEEDARDVVQVTFVRLWEHRARFDDRWSPNTWIYRIATNLAIDLLRSRRSRERIQEPARHHLRSVADANSRRPLADLHGREVRRIFDELAAGLSAKQRLVFLLREVEGLSSQEVAAIAECQESTVRNHLFNARKFLQREVRRRYPEYAGRHRGKGEEERS